jgi:hypothetical protein
MKCEISNLKCRHSWLALLTPQLSPRNLPLSTFFNGARRIAELGGGQRFDFLARKRLLFKVR